MANDLTLKQEKFVQELIKGKSQRQAYKAAYNAKKMADSTIDSHASRLFKNDKVRARYEKLRGKVVKRAEEKAIITAEEVLSGIAEIARDNIGNYLEYKTVKTVVEREDDGKPIFGYRTVIDFKDSKDINTGNISEISISESGTLKIKTYCKDKALYKLAEIMGLDEAGKAKQKLAEDKFEHEKDMDSKKVW